MSFKLEALDISKDPIRENISFIRVDRSTGEIDLESNDNFYFELFLNEKTN